MLEKKPNIHKRHLLSLLLITGLDASATESIPITLEIPGMSLSESLNQLAKTTNKKLIYNVSAFKDLKAEPLKGQFTIEQALNKLLIKNGLEYQTNKDGEILIKQASTTKSQSKSDNSIFELGEVVVTERDNGGKLNSQDIATSVDVMYADKIADQNVLNAYDLFHRMPGVQITQYGQGITTGKLSFRGFNGEGRVNAVKLLIDGIPSNTNDGNMPFIDALFPLDIESIEVVRGTNDPRYGLHNIAGNANITTAAGGSYAKGRMSYGSFNTHEVQSGLGYEKDGFSQNYAISYRGSDGYRDHSQSDKNSFSGKWAFKPNDEKYNIGLSLRWSEAEAQEPGYLTYQEQLISTTQSMPRNATDGGKRQMGQVSTHFDLHLTATLFWSNKAYSNTYRDQRFVKFEPVFGQVERLRDETQYGAITSLTYHPVLDWLNDFSVESGFDFQQQDNRYQQYSANNGVRGATRSSDESWNFLNYGGYIQAVIKPTSWLKITPGYRADRVDGNLTNLNPRTKFPTVFNIINDYGIISQPKIGAVLTPIEGYSLYGNWGRSFQVGLGSATYKAPAAASIAPSINDGWEVGVKLKPLDWAEARIAYWRQDASNEMSRNLKDSTST